MHLWTELPKAHAERVQEILRYKISDLRPDHPCGVRRRRNDWILATIVGAVKSATGSINGQTGWYGSSSAASSSQAQPKTGIGQAGRSSASQKTPLHYRPTAIQPQNPAISISMPQMSESRVLFGVKGPRRTLELAQIDTAQYNQDEAFFAQMKKEYRKHRGSLRYWLSLWQFNHCDFVQVHMLEQVSCHVNADRGEVPKIQTKSSYVARKKPPY